MCSQPVAGCSDIAFSAACIFVTEIGCVGCSDAVLRMELKASVLWVAVELNITVD